MKKFIKSSFEDWYFGKEKAEQFGDMIAEKAAGKKISKRQDIAEEPGGLIYEANALGIDMWDLLEALEGMCHDGRAREIDDSTYRVLWNDKQVTSSRKIMCSDSDGWDEEHLYEVLDILAQIYDIQYEIESCTRGAYSNCKTYEQLGYKLKELGEALAEAGDDLMNQDEPKE